MTETSSNGPGKGYDVSQCCIFHNSKKTHEYFFYIAAPVKDMLLHEKASGSSFNLAFGCVRQFCIDNLRI